MIEKGMWRGERCFIVGGGPSLSRFDWDSLRGQLVIGVNRAFEYCSPNIILSLDLRFFRAVLDLEYGRIVKQKFLKSSADKIWVAPEHFEDELEDLPDLIRIRRAGGFGVNHYWDNGLYTGGNSGYAALMLASVLGAKEICLLGFDMKPGHFAPHPFTGASERTYKEWIEHFDYAAPRLKARVINCSKESAIECFEKIPFDSLPESKPRSVLVKGYMGFGDNLHQRPLVRDLIRRGREVYLETPVTQLYWDFPSVRFVKPGTGLRTQSKAMESAGVDWWIPPSNAEIIRVAHSGQDMFKGVSVTERFADAIDGRYDFSFRPKQEWIDAAKELIGDKPVCLVHPPTVRKEWTCRARNPKVGLMQSVIDKHRSKYQFISVADLCEGEEWTEDPVSVDVAYEHGELPVTTVLGLCYLSSMVLCSPSFFMLMGIAMRRPTCCLFGGHIPPEILVHPMMGLDMFEYAAPEPFCFCSPHVSDHEGCYKDMDVSGVFQLQETVRVGMPAGIGDMHWCLLKLESFKKKHGINHLTVVVHEDSGHTSSCDFLRGIPFVDAVENKPDNFSWQWCLHADKRGTDCVQDVDGIEWRIEANSHLEMGKRIEDWLPGLDINWDYEIPIPRDAHARALGIQAKAGGDLYVYYTSGVANQDYPGWVNGKWDIDDWETLLKLTVERTGCLPVVIGAAHDVDYVRKLKSPMINMCGKTNIWDALALLKLCNGFAGFPSGMGVMAAHFGRRTVMFWPESMFSDGMLRAWVRPNSCQYFPMRYGSPGATPENVAEILFSCNNTGKEFS